MSAEAQAASARSHKANMGLFERYLSLWVGLCIVVGIVLGQVLPTAFRAAGRLEIAQINLPVAILV
jgi:ACR3 family arsenite transporter